MNTRHFVMYVLCDQTETRFGFTVSRKIGKAVVRNRVRRRLAEVVYRNLDRFPEGRWWVFNTKRASAHATYQMLEADLVAAVNRYVETCGSFPD